MIEVRVTHADAMKVTSAEAFEAWLLHRLRQAGIPIIGAFDFQGVQSGLLIAVDAPDANTIRQFRWYSDPDRVAIETSHAMTEGRWLVLVDHPLFPSSKIELNIPK